MEKRTRNLLTVGEVAKILGINKNTVLHYDREGVIKAIRNDSNYRFYNEKKLKNFRSVLKLRKLGFSLETIKDIGKYVKNKNYTAVIEIMREKVEENKKRIEEIEEDMKALESNEKYMEYLNDIVEEEGEDSIEEPENFFCIKRCEEEKGIFIDIDDVERNLINQKRFIEKELKRYKKDFTWLKKQFFGKGISQEKILEKNYECDMFIIKADIENYPDKYIFPEGEYAFLYIKKGSKKEFVMKDFLNKIKNSGYKIAGDLFVEEISLFAEKENEEEVRILKILIKPLTSE